MTRLNVSFTLLNFVSACVTKMRKKQHLWTNCPLGEFSVGELSVGRFVRGQIITEQIVGGRIVR